MTTQSTIRYRFAVAVALLAVTAVTTSCRPSRAHRLDEARSYLRSSLYDGHDLAGAAAYLDRLAGEAGGDRALQLEIARAYLRLGDTEGLPIPPTVRNPAAALESYRKAHRLFLALPPANDEAEVGGDWSAASKHQASLLFELHRPEEARAAAGHAVALVEALTARYPSEGASEQLASAYGVMADVAEDPAPWRLKALTQLQRALSVRLKLAARDPLNAATQEEIIAFDTQIAGTLRALKQPRDALNYYLDAVRAGRGLTARNPRDDRYRSTLAKSLEQAGALLQDSGALVEACQSRSAALDLYTAIDLEKPLQGTDRAGLDTLRKATSGCAR